MIIKSAKQFINFHEGFANKIFHIAGFSIIGIGIAQKSLIFVIIGAITQELGHLYQYLKTKNPKDNPLQGLKSQSIFAFPIFILIVIYVVFF